MGGDEAAGGARRRPWDARIRRLLREERQRFAQSHPRSAELFRQAQGALLGGMPMNWMHRWPGGFPLFVDQGSGCRVRDADGFEYVDFCLGDTGAMTGHAPSAVQAILAERFARGATFMLPTADAIWVAEELRRRFGLGHWQFALTATDANRFALRIARAVTGRRKILVFHGCYHGTVDETFAVLERGEVVAREGNLGAPVHPAETTKVVQMNDPASLRDALMPRDVAAVLMEPWMTNVGIVAPLPGFLEEVRRLTEAAGTLWIVDETHTISAGPGGVTGREGLKPDILTVGKPLASGIPAAAYGFSDQVAARAEAVTGGLAADTSGIGGTLAANALSLAAMRATLEEVLTAGAYAAMEETGRLFAAQVQEVIDERDLPWSVVRLGGRVEYLFRDTPPQSGGEALAASDAELDALMHLYLLNRGVLMTPFHNMALMSPATTADDVGRHTAVFREAVAALLD